MKVKPGPVSEIIYPGFPPVEPANTRDRLAAIIRMTDYAMVSDMLYAIERAGVRNTGLKAISSGRIVVEIRKRVYNVVAEIKPPDDTPLFHLASCIDNGMDALRAAWPGLKGELQSLWNKLKTVAAQEEKPEPVALATVPDEPAKRTHSTDFTTAEWDGTKYTFSPLQADTVKALWQEYEKTGFGLHQNAIRESLDHERGNFRVPHVFRKHPAYGVMIHSCGRGKYRLGKPDAITKTKTKTPSKKPVKAKAAATVPPVSSNGLSPLGMRAKQKIEAEYAAAHPED